MSEPSARKKQVLVWESEVTTTGAGRVEITARQPLSHLSVRQTAKVLGLSTWSVGDLFRLGLITGFKPGARRVRSDGRASNAALRLNAESVLDYKRQRESASIDWQERH